MPRLLIAILAVGLLCLLPPVAFADGPGIPCVVRGNVTFDGVPVDGALVVSSMNTSDVSFNGGDYGVDVVGGASGLWIVATYQGHTNGVNLSRTPDSGGFAYQDIAIVSGSSSPATTPGDSPSGGGKAAPAAGDALIDLAGLAIATFLLRPARDRPS